VIADQKRNAETKTEECLPNGEKANRMGWGWGLGGSKKRFFFTDNGRRKVTRESLSQKIGRSAERRDRNTSQAMYYNVTLMRVRVTIVAVEEQ